VKYMGSIGGVWRTPRVRCMLDLGLGLSLGLDRTKFGSG
jgi:hypothetical protein